jgi:hypothetical protein
LTGADIFLLLVMDCLEIFGWRTKRQIRFACAWLIICVALLSSCGRPAVLQPSDEPEPAPRHAKPVQVPQNAKPAPARSAVRPAKLPDIKFTIQVGAFSTSGGAAAFAARLIQRGLDAYYFVDADGLYKVRLERFDSRNAAYERALRLQFLGWIDDFFVVQPVAQHHLIDPRLSLGREIVRTAGRFVGKAYRWGGESAKAGFDCSGLTMTVYRLNGLDLPRSSREQFRAGNPIKRSELKEGDLVFFATVRRSQRVSHVGIYVGGGRFIHAPGRGKKIRSASLSSGYFKWRYVGARRYF